MARAELATIKLRVSRELIETVKLRNDLGHALRLELDDEPDAEGFHGLTVTTDMEDSLRPLDWEEWPEAKVLAVVARELGRGAARTVYFINKRLDREGIRLNIFDHGGVWDVGLTPPAGEVVGV